MRKIVSICLTAFLLYGCGSVAITGRRQILLFDSGQIASLSDAAYTEVMSTAVPSRNVQQTRMVQDVGNRLVQAVTNYMKQNGRERQLAPFSWGFTLVESNEVNAFCLPNGKVVVYEGILRFASTPDKLAVVIGHELAHVVAQHGNERMTHEVIVNMGAAVGDAVLSNSERNRAIFGAVYGVGSNFLGLLPYSRAHEYEADRLGLIFMAMAGYDIDQAPVFWEQMSQNSGPKPPEFLSTHPSDANRQANLKALIPEAARYAPPK
ncbi:MAG: M48 family metallopeptidase [Bacteroidales bacterium]|nr:M48 family metallopeptidase [Bacteroidales bacterium]MCL2738490.1 M48 family metallopeptidase [Bacteroidales bacterium]